jgi:hypothetical protein
VVVRDQMKKILFGVKACFVAIGAFILGFIGFTLIRMNSKSSVETNSIDTENDNSQKAIDELSQSRKDLKDLP